MSNVLSRVPWNYVIKRIIIFVPTLFIIALVTFVISINAPGDPVEFFLQRGAGMEGSRADKLATQKAYLEIRKRLGLDLPIFYFSIIPACYSDTLYRIPGRDIQAVLKYLSWEYGNWKKVEEYYHSLIAFDLALYGFEVPEEMLSTVRKLRESVFSLQRTKNKEQIEEIIYTIKGIIESSFYLKPLLFAKINDLSRKYEEMKESKNIIWRYIPKFVWYGIENQFHIWLFGDAPWIGEEKVFYRSKGIIRGDFGISYLDKRPVSSILSEALPWTAFLSVIAIILSYLIAIPIGVLSAVWRNTVWERVITVFLFLLYSMPTFWIGSMAIIFLCSPDYLDIFPATGLPAFSEGSSFFDQISLYHLFLPIVIWTYPSLAFISRQARSSMINILGVDFIRTARAKGLPERKVIWGHAFQNSLIPIITLLANVFPAAVTGSFVIEYIFSIPGMGKVALDAIVARDYPVVFADVFLVTVLTLIGMLVSDILYAIIDPRISFEK